ncbi:hypothetical protein BGW36DRAFT_378847 [Talaromyces proteolyticus]|uniref:Transcription factor domain-containing protein n=1 Tax=Talaromyces proteolyticus TaxID=1131652 RepID=A0AAD4PYA1_9EURO|nr:uncharacterized protein BGW36DRAFT_378847 [Talaromyces proteolyticus]KAH8697529.1 hypothetical protein BGW36DRAFT_378847 [Talaromyces proteolyticus]
MQRDYRYWLSNATYIATKMGLHRNVVGQRLDGSTRKLFRRIWCILYSWDVLLALNGMDTMRRFRDSDSETCTAEITEDDWEDDPIPEVFQEFLHPIKNVEKSYVIEGGKLSLLIAQFWQRFSSTPLDACYTQLTVAMDSWRESLPPSFRTPAIQETSVVNTWNLILMARGYVCECIMHRMIIRSAGTNESLRLRAGQKLSSALFELNTIIDRIMNQNTGQFNSWVLHGFISTALALHVEKALNPALTSLERSMTNLRIQVNLEFLRDMAKTWSYIGVMVRVFEGVIRRYGLVTSLPESESIPNDIGAFPQQSPDVLNLLGTPTMPRPNPWMFGPADKNIALDLGMGDLNANSVLEELLYDNTLSWDISKLI